MKLTNLISALESIAPLDLAESWDKVGLAVGDPGADVGRVLLCIDLTEAVLDEAAVADAGLIVAYHPPIFEPMATITATDPRGRLIHRAIREGRAVYSPHTALDAVEGGVNDWLADAAGGDGAESSRSAIRPARSGGGEVKLVAFVPESPPSLMDDLRRALSDSGAGVIGDYRECSWSVDGEGTFLGGDSTNPTIGQRGAFERVKERRLEMVCAVGRVDEVIATLRRVHPYEEPAFDLVPLSPSPRPGVVGQGRILEFAKPAPVNAVVDRVRAATGTRRASLAGPLAGGGEVRRLALCAGAGGSLLSEARRGEGLDLFVTGEMSHHHVLHATMSGVSVLLAGHTETERGYLPVLARRLSERLGGGAEVEVSGADAAPLTPA